MSVIVATPTPSKWPVGHPMAPVSKYWSRHCCYGPQFGTALGPE